MKKALMTLAVLSTLSSYVMAQENYREATPEEADIILTEVGEEQLQAMGIGLAQENERIFVQNTLVQEAVINEGLTEIQRRDYLQHLTNLELSKEEIIQNISEISDKYFAAINPQDEFKKVQFKNSLLETLANNTFVKEAVQIDPNAFSPIKIMVPKSFSWEKPTLGVPLCTNDYDEEKKPLVHQVYFSWGYNRNYHSNTDVKFTTPDGTFTVHDTVGKDRPTAFDPKIYFNPTKLSIPQYNVELGVMFNEKWGLELKQDHMKLVFDNTRPYEITGDYNHQVVVPNENAVADWDTVKPVDFEVAKQNKDASWLKFEHSDGYNYIAAGAVYNQRLYKTQNEKFAIDTRFGAGAGLMIPKTAVAFHQDQSWNWEGLDNKFHIAGGGVHADVKLKLTFWNSVYLQAATRGTYIKVKDALVDGTESRMEHVQPIASVQFMGQVGYQYTFKQKQKDKTPKKL